VLIDRIGGVSRQVRTGRLDRGHGPGQFEWQPAVRGGRAEEHVEQAVLGAAVVGDDGGSVVRQRAKDGGTVQVHIENDGDAPAEFRDAGKRPGVEVEGPRVEPGLEEVTVAGFVGCPQAEDGDVGLGRMGHRDAVFAQLLVADVG
jgi:hypothetical protein